MEVAPTSRVRLLRATLLAAFYLVSFVVLTWPVALHWTTHLVCDEGDGMMTYWNLWWMRKALVDLHVWPYYTTYLHFPHGISLIGHPLHPFNGLLAVPLLSLLPLEIVHNLVLVFSFVVGGLTAYALCRHVSGSFGGSVVGGFVFTFSSFHFAHAQGHLHMVSLEWLPLFLLAWLRWLESPTVRRAAAAAGALLLVFLCDLYFLVFSVLAAAFVSSWWAARNFPALRARARAYAGSGLAFAVLAGLPVGGFVIVLLLQHQSDPLLGAHDPSKLGMDLLAPFIYGGHWRFRALTEPFWSRLAGNVHESSLHLGWSVLAALFYCAWRRRDIANPNVGMWLGVAAFFALLALGPVLHVWGVPYERVPMPYAILGKVFPVLRFGGAVSRFFIMTYLAVGVLVAIVFPYLRAGLLSARWRLVLASALLVLEYWPSPLPLTRIPVPGSIVAVAEAPGDGAVIDLVNRPLRQLYYQTIHGKPIAGGRIGRFPTSAIVRGYPVALAARAVFKSDDPDADRVRELAAYGFRYAIVKRTERAIPLLRVRYADDAVVVYDFPTE